jgi:transglutaminase-like putative cysteine protease
MHQSPEDVVRVFDEFVRGHKSPHLILDSQSVEARYNADLLLEYVVKKYGWVTITYLQEADQALGAKLYRTLPPRVKTQDELAAEFQAKELVRIQREQLENAVPFQDRMVAAEKAKQEAKAEVQRQASAKGERDRLIDNYTINLGPGRIDHGRSEYLREQLRGIKAKRPDGTMDWTVVLKLVQEALSNMP